LLTLADPLEHARRIHGDRIAVVDGETRMTYRALHERCERLAGALQHLGVGRGDRVAVLAANGHRYVEATCALPAYGMVVVPLNTRLAEPELRAILADCGARVLLADRDPGALRQCVDRVVSMPDDYEAMLAGRAIPRRFAVDENDPAALFYTGGTTGKSKGVILTHRNLVANAFHKVVACSLDASDVFLAAPPMFHVAGVAPLVGLVWNGARSVTVPSFDADKCLDVIERERITVFMPVPTMLASLVARQQAAARDVSSLRMLGHAGAPIANALIEAAHATFPSSEIAQFYGATETSSIVTCFRHEEAAIGTPRLGSCGRAVAGVSVRVVRPDGIECPPGEAGEIAVRGPNVTAGYWHDPAATSAALVDGWYRTGDVGVMDADGFLFVVDRIKDMIVSGAENVYSIEVEDILYRHPAVIEAAVFGVPDDRWGEAVYAIVVVERRAPSEDDFVAELKEHCRRSIAGYKVPKRIEVRTEPLPKSGPGKVLKRVLRHAHWEGRRS